MNGPFLPLSVGLRPGEQHPSIFPTKNYLFPCAVAGRSRYDPRSQPVSSLISSSKPGKEIFTHSQPLITVSPSAQRAATARAMAMR